jgi:hypothetical protein
MTEHHSPSPEAPPQVGRPDPALKRLERRNWSARARSKAAHSTHTGLHGTVVVRMHATTHRRGDAADGARSRWALPRVGKSTSRDWQRLAQQQVAMPGGDSVPTATRVITRQRCEATPSRKWLCACTGVAGPAAARARENGMEQESR